MKSRRPDTFLLTLPDGKKVRCWRRDAEKIRRDVYLTRSVSLRENPETGVYDWIDSNSIEGAEHAAIARRVTG